MEILVRNDKQFLEEMIASQDIDSDDNESEETLDSRFNDLNIDDLSGIWNKLNDSEKRQFKELVKSGKIGEFVELWTPWWTSGASGRPLICQLDDSQSEQNSDVKDETSRLPELMTNISQLKDLISVSLVKCFVIESIDQLIVNRNLCRHRSVQQW